MSYYNEMVMGLPRQTNEEAALRERAEAILEAQRQEAERQRLRDQFAAAALTGMLDKHDAGGDVAAWWPEMACNAAYRWADAMMAERDRRVKQPEVK